MDIIWDRKSFEVGGHWPLWRGWKNRMTTQNRQKWNAKNTPKNNLSHPPLEIESIKQPVGGFTLYFVPFRLSFVNISWATNCIMKPWLIIVTMDWHGNGVLGTMSVTLELTPLECLGYLFWLEKCGKQLSLVLNLVIFSQLGIYSNSACKGYIKRRWIWEHSCWCQTVKQLSNNQV